MTRLPLSHIAAEEGHFLIVLKFLLRIQAANRKRPLEMVSWNGEVRGYVPKRNASRSRKSRRVEIDASPARPLPSTRDFDVDIFYHHLSFLCRICSSIIDSLLLLTRDT